MAPSLLEIRSRSVTAVLVVACALAMHSAAAQQGSLRSQQDDAAGTAQRRLYSTSTSYCYENDSPLLGNCWQNKPGSSTPACTPSSGRTTCLCPGDAGVGCNLDALDQQPPTTGRCAEIEVYVPGGERHTQVGTGSIDVTGSAPLVYCRNMTLNNKWAERGLVASPDDGAAETSSSWWGCWYPYTWKDGMCQRRTRFLGETCWDGSTNYLLGTAGVCAGSDTSYDEYSTSCYSSRCTPYAMAREREECTCAWVGWNFLVACSAAEDKCGGHACVLTTRNMKKYCDYATSQDW